MNGQQQSVSVNNNIQNLGGQQNVGNFLQSPQQSGDLDVTAAIRQIMVSFGCNAESVVIYDNSPLVQQSLGKSPQAQLWLQKEYWIYQLSLVPGTMEDRIILQQIADPVTWVKHFSMNIMCIALENILPKRHGW